MEERLSGSAESKASVDSGGASGSPGESQQVRRSSRASPGERARHHQDRDIVQRSASEQAH